MARHLVRGGNELAQPNEYASGFHIIDLVHHPELVCKKPDISVVGGSFEPPCEFFVVRMS